MHSVGPVTSIKTVSACPFLSLVMCLAFAALQQRETPETEERDSEDGYESGDNLPGEYLSIVILYQYTQLLQLHSNRCLRSMLRMVCIFLLLYECACTQLLHSTTNRCTCT